MMAPKDRRQEVVSQESFLIVEGVRLDERILTTPYTCDPAFYNCQSHCCYRGCILSQAEIDRIRPHLPEIVSFLPSGERKDRLARGLFVADCSAQCPGGCEMHGLEWKAVQIHFQQGESPRCVSYPHRICLFAYEEDESRLCAIHSYALKKGMKLTEIKPLDCIQYPLYLGEDEEGRFLGIQETPHLSHIPCMRDPRGKPMVLSLGYAIEALLGNEFYQALLKIFDRYASSAPARRS